MVPCVVVLREIERERDGGGSRIWFRLFVFGGGGGGGKD